MSINVPAKFTDTIPESPGLTAWVTYETVENERTSGGPVGLYLHGVTAAVSFDVDGRRYYGWRQVDGGYLHGPDDLVWQPTKVFVDGDVLDPEDDGRFPCMVRMKIDTSFAVMQSHTVLS